MKYLRKLYTSCNAVSSVVGSLLIFSITIICITVMFLYSVPVIAEMQDDAEAQKVEQAFTILDSRISKVALGESPLQTTSITLGEGSINVNGPGEADKSRMTIQIINQTDNTKEEFNCSLGTIEYIKDDRKVAYEGGGVWSNYGSKGGTVMVSPPEFHYNGVTLTLPIMTIDGMSSSSGKGDVDIAVTSDNKPHILYPNVSASVLRKNPVVHDKIIVYIESQYYDAWADYADTLVYTSATLDDANETAIIEFYTTPPMGTFSLTNKIKMGQVNESSLQPVQDFNFHFEAAKSQGLNPKKYEMIATSKTKTLVYSLQKKGGADQLELYVTYMDTSIGPDYIEHWEGIDVFPIDGKQADEFTSVDLLNESFIMEYNPPLLDGADTDFSWGPSGTTSELPNVVINKTSGYDQYTLDDITQHYIKLMTKEDLIEFTLDGGSQDPMDYSTSKVTLNYDSLGNVITYLHVTQNELNAYVVN
ncbi:hypothetical protein [Methanococcoides sp. AM1]|uniref:DUF7289 family protein n=1 Tax=Methanococcoides sp. AM1 TaxID=1201011 RepID=UPI0010836D74|nr:hypothetical protein [Methanococcoides sp. AM1]